MGTRDPQNALASSTTVYTTVGKARFAAGSFLPTRGPLAEQL